jgi:hypothetical protein
MPASQWPGGSLILLLRAGTLLTVKRHLLLLWQAITLTVLC